MYNFEEIKAIISGRQGYFVFTDYLEPIHADTEILYDKDGVFIQHNPGSEMLIKGLTAEHLKEIVESYVVDIEDPSDYNDYYDPYDDYDTSDNYEVLYDGLRNRVSRHTEELLILLGHTADTLACELQVSVQDVERIMSRLKDKIKETTNL